MWDGPCIPESVPTRGFTRHISVNRCQAVSWMPMGISSPEIQSWCWGGEGSSYCWLYWSCPWHQPLGPEYVTCVPPDADSCFTAPCYGFVPGPVSSHSQPSLCFFLCSLFHGDSLFSFLLGYSQTLTWTAPLV